MSGVYAFRVSKDITPTDPERELSLGRIPLWLDPEEVRWIADRDICGLGATGQHTPECGRIRWKAESALHKAGLKEAASNMGQIHSPGMSSLRGGSEAAATPLHDRDDFDTLESIMRPLVLGEITGARFTYPRLLLLDLGTGVSGTGSRCTIETGCSWSITRPDRFAFRFNARTSDEELGLAAVRQLLGKTIDDLHVYEEYLDVAFKTTGGWGFRIWTGHARSEAAGIERSFRYYRFVDRDALVHLDVGPGRGYSITPRK